MKLLFLLFIAALLPMFVLCQLHDKTKIILDKTYRIDSSLQPYFGIQREIITEIATIDETALKENTESLLSADLHAVRDPFQSASSFQFSAIHFKEKGLNGNYARVTVNGSPMQDLASGMGLWNHWQGLNTVFKIDENNNGFLPNSYAVAAIGQSNNIDIRASKQKAQTNFDYGFSNRAYTHRFQFTTSSGISKNGWAFSISGGGNYTAQPAVPGCFQNSLNFYLAIDKQINRQLFSIAFFAADINNARQAYTLKESTNILQDPLYNPNWGYQNQVPRNAHISAQLVPVLMLTHEWRFNNQVYWQTTLSASSGTKNTTGLNWFHAPDPRPEYYRYLPSFQTDPILIEQVTDAIQNDINLQQINWDKLYAANRISEFTIQDANGIVGNNISGKLARYFVENRKTDIQHLNFASSFHGRIGASVLFDMGLMASMQQLHYYKTVNDLLGADFFVNWNQFAENELPVNANAIQFDLQKPNRIIKVGDAFGYDYSMMHTKTEAWFSSVIPFKRFQISVASSVATTQFWRVGNIVNGLFPDHSLGKSQVNNFIHSGIKLGINYAINGKQTIFLSASNLTQPPSSDNVFISPTTRDTEQEHLINEIMYGAELGYLLHAQKLKLHASLYYINSKNGLDVLSFYHDAYNSFVNYAISGIGQTHYGYEFGMDLHVSNKMNVQIAATNGQHFFNSRQFAIVTADNSAVELESVLIYAKNYPSINSPQAAYSFSLNYRTNSQWFASLNASYFDQQWMGWNPIRRTAEAIYPVDQSTEKGQQLLIVEKLPAISICNFFISHGFQWGKKNIHRFTYSLSINNLFNKQDIIIAANEQLRFDFDNKDPNKFPPKYLHGMGRNFLISLHYSF